MADSTRLTGEVAERGEITPSPRLKGKMLEGVPERARRSGMNEARMLARGIPTEFEVPGGEKVTLLMRGKPDTGRDPRDVDLAEELMLLDIALARIGLPERPFNEMIMPERLTFNIAPLDRLDLIYIDVRTER
ncbi:hypothetical protein H0O01_03640 [Candidatus Micrarchaeota archaeon]|nr:hypothetical protein [Candidatus Micrarchaeota archaeon]